MDCNNLIEFAEERERMCTCRGESKANCDPRICELRSAVLKFGYTGRYMSHECRRFCLEHPDVAVQVVQRWSDANPRRTYKSVFLEKMPMAVCNEHGTPLPCRNLVFGIGDFEGKCRSDKGCGVCWNEVYNGK